MLFCFSRPNFLLEGHQRLNRCEFFKVLTNLWELIRTLIFEKVKGHVECIINTNIFSSKLSVLLQASFKELNILSQFIHLQTFVLNFLFVLEHESVRMDYFLNFDLVEHLLSLSCLELESVHLERKYIGQLFNPVNLFSSDVLTLFDLIILNDAAIFAIPNCVEVFTLRHI